MLRLLDAVALAIAVTLPTQWASAALNLNTATKDELIVKDPTLDLDRPKVDREKQRRTWH